MRTALLTQPWYGLGRPLRCPRCGVEDVLRAQARSSLERGLRWLRIMPVRCQSCSRRFYAWHVGTRCPSAIVDRRQHTRIPVRLQLSFSGGRVRGAGTVKNVSMGGCLIETGTIVQVNDIFYLELSLPDGQLPVELAGIVRSVGPEGIAFQFLRGGRDNKRLFDFLHGAPARRPS